MKRLPLILIISFFVIVAIVTYKTLYHETVDAGQLVNDYTNNKEEADKRYLNKVINIKGTVKAYYKMMGTRSVLELDTYNSGSNLFFFFLKESDEFDASQLQQGQNVTITGQCVGTEKYKFVHGVKVEVESISSD